MPSIQIFSLWDYLIFIVISSVAWARSLSSCTKKVSLDKYWQEEHKNIEEKNASNIKVPLEYSECQKTLRDIIDKFE